MKKMRKSASNVNNAVNLISGAYTVNSSKRGHMLRTNGALSPF